MDADTDRSDDDDDTWNPVFVYKHHVVKYLRRQLALKIGWTHHDPTSEEIYAIQLQNPFIVMDYALRNNLLKYP
jgi:hypothetical protein